MHATEVRQICPSAVKPGGNSWRPKRQADTYPMVESRGQGGLLVVTYVGVCQPWGRDAFSLPAARPL